MIFTFHSETITFSISYLFTTNKCNLRKSYHGNLFLWFILPINVDLNYQHTYNKWSHAFNMSSMKHDKFATWKICLKEINKPYTRCQYPMLITQHIHIHTKTSNLTLYYYYCVFVQRVSKYLNELPYQKRMVNNNTRKNLQVGWITNEM